MFRTNEKLLKAGTILFDLSILNILFIVGSLPLTTIGPALCALFNVVGKIVRGEPYLVLKDFSRSYRENLKTGVSLHLILSFFTAVLIFNIVFLHTHQLPKMLLFFNAILLIELIFVGMYAYPLLCRYEIKIKNLLVLSFYIANTNLLKSFVGIGLLILSLYLTYFFPVLLIFFTASVFAMLYYHYVLDIINTDWDEHWQEQEKYKK
jgi:uncharacterized membrane protein YesL